MAPLPGNSNIDKEKVESITDLDNEKGITSLVDGEATFHKPSGFRRLRRSFIRGDATTVSEHIIWNLLIPAAKDTVADMGATFIDMMIFGERRTPRGISSGHVAPNQGPGSTSRFNYGGITSGSPLVLGQHSAPQDDYENQIIPNQVVVGHRSEADAIINKMQDLIVRYTAVSVADLYRMANRTPNYMDDRWGWTSLEGYKLKRVPHGVLLDLPEPKDIS